MKFQLVLIKLCFVFCLQASSVERNQSNCFNGSLICKSLDYIEELANRSAAINSVARLQRHIEGQVSNRVWASFLDGKEDLRSIFHSKYAAQKLGLIPSNVEAIEKLIEKYRIVDPNFGNKRVLIFAYAVMPHFIASRYEDRTTDLVDAHIEERYAFTHMSNPLNYILLKESNFVDRKDIFQDPSICREKEFALAIYHKYYEEKDGKRRYLHTLKQVNFNSRIKTLGSLSLNYPEDFNGVITLESFGVNTASLNKPLKYFIIKSPYKYSSLPEINLDVFSGIYVFDGDIGINSLSALGIKYLDHLILVGKNIKRIMNQSGSGSNIDRITFYGLESVEEIGDNFLRAFYFLREIDFSEFKKLKKIGANFLFKVTYLKKVSTFGLENVEEVGNFFLYGCESLEDIDLSGLKKVEKIGNFFLEGSRKLKKFSTVGLENVKELGDGFLNDCQSLKEVDLSGLKKVEKIGYRFLYNCNRLNRVIMTKEVYDVLRVDNDDFLRLNSDKIIVNSDKIIVNSDKIIVNGQLENNASSSCVIQ